MPFPRPAPEQRKWWLFGGVTITIAVLVIVWFGLSATAGITWTDTGHQTVDDRTIKARFDVVDADRGPVTCTLAALSETKAVVGKRTVELPPSEFESTRHTVPVKTAERAVAVQVDECIRTGSAER
ncbi:DUF4307 domain-containing protein [Demetria terragena]|uniref:DUF4307 domain-containing protein n=1 Tax=Demetria terragena TaxID=63959 RepID=UPI00037C4028|nr:DUF4307 domain-containing protein [Demetria terragena]